MPEPAILPMPHVPAADRPLPLLLTQQQAWMFLGVSRSAWFRLRGAGRLPRPVAPDGALLWRRADLDRWAERLRPAR
jgi:predicted DNA-binding transcriptional regulator AlpA